MSLYNLDLNTFVQKCLTVKQQDKYNKSSEFRTVIAKIYAKFSNMCEYCCIYQKIKKQKGTSNYETNGLCRDHFYLVEAHKRQKGQEQLHSLINDALDTLKHSIFRITEFQKIEDRLNAYDKEQESIHYIDTEKEIKSLNDTRLQRLQNWMMQQFDSRYIQIVYGGPWQDFDPKENYLNKYSSDSGHTSDSDDEFWFWSDYPDNMTDYYSIDPTNTNDSKKRKYDKEPDNSIKKMKM